MIIVKTSKGCELKIMWTEDFVVLYDVLILLFLTELNFRQKDKSHKSIEIFETTKKLKA